MGISNSLGGPKRTYDYDEFLARGGAPWTLNFVKTRCDGRPSLLVYIGTKSDTAPDGVRLRLSANIFKSD